MSNFSRRQFLEDSMFATAAAIAAATANQVVAQDDKKVSPLERLRVAHIGVNGQGGAHVDNMKRNKDAEVVAICDVDPAAFQKQLRKFDAKGKQPEYVQDLRKLLERKDIDAVTIATPNHWHALAAIWAMQAGKDVYVEKPVSHNVSEGRRMVETARKLGKICQTGTQSRSNKGMREIIEYVHSGKLGKITLSKGFCYKPRGTIGKSDGPCKIPEGLNVDLWIGPAPSTTIVRKRFHYDWHWFWAYGNGDLGNQGIHEMDKARWGLNKNELPKRAFSFGGRFGYEDDGETANTQLCYFDWDDGSQLIFEVRGLKSGEFYKAKTARGRGAMIGNMWIGTNGYAVSTNYQSGTAFDPDGKEIVSFNGGDYGDHFANFIKAVRSRNYKDLNADIEQGHLSSALCHLGNVSYRCGSPKAVDGVTALAGTNKNRTETVAGFLEHLKANNVDPNSIKIQCGCEVAIDPKSESSPNADCNKMFTREYRKGFEVPAKV